MAPLKVDGIAIMSAESASVVAILRKSSSSQAVGAIVEDSHTHFEWLADGAKTSSPLVRSPAPRDVPFAAICGWSRRFPRFSGSPRRSGRATMWRPSAAG